MSDPSKEQNEDNYQEILRDVKESVEDKTYFKDALEWYFFRYLTPVCDRTLLLISGIISVMVMTLLFQMIQNTYPLVEEFPIFYKPTDQSLYVPKLVQLKTRKIGVETEDQKQQTVDESVLKYLLSYYIRIREGFDFKDAQIAKVNKKFNAIKNLSSPTEYKKFQTFMNRDNPSSPLRFFGQSVEKVVNIESLEFIRKVPKNFAEKAKEFIVASIPTKAQVRFSTVTTKTNVNTGEVTQKKDFFVVRLDFYFAGIDKDHEGPLNFEVTNYELFRVK